MKLLGQHMTKNACAVLFSFVMAQAGLGACASSASDANEDGRGGADDEAEGGAGGSQRGGRGGSGGRAGAAGTDDEAETDAAAGTGGMGGGPALMGGKGGSSSLMVDAGVSPDGAVTMPSPDGTVVFDFDFRLGRPTPAGPVTLKVEGGEWQDGWRTVSGSDQMIIDAGKVIKEGYVEATFTMKGTPWSQGGKLDWIGVFENADVHQRSGGDLFFLRTGEAKYGFSMPKAYGKAVDMKEWHRIPSDAEAAMDRAEWSTDDSKEMTVRLEWKQGIAIVHHPRARVHRCPETICSSAFPIDEIRYVALGRDGYSPESLLGIRFRRVRFVAY